jgi:hypothetical protein
LAYAFAYIFAYVLAYANADIYASYDAPHTVAHVESDAIGDDTPAHSHGLSNICPYVTPHI